jgi:hypothetical protein
MAAIAWFSRQAALISLENARLGVADDNQLSRENTYVTGMAHPPWASTEKLEYSHVTWTTSFGGALRSGG